MDPVCVGVGLHVCKISPELVSGSETNLYDNKTTKIGMPIFQNTRLFEINLGHTGFRDYCVSRLKVTPVYRRLILNGYFN